MTLRGSLRRHYWVAIVLTIAGSGWLIARTTGTFIGSALQPPPMPDQTTGAQPSAPPQVAASGAAIGHLFGIVPPAPAVRLPEESGVEASALTGVCMTCEPVRTGLRLQLLATMVASEPEFSTALITDLDKGTTSLFQIRDSIRGAEIHSIVRAPQRVVIINRETHRLEFIDGTATAGMLADTVTPGTASEDARIRKAGENQFRISRQKLNVVLSNMDGLAAMGRVVPVAEGFKLFSIPPGSFYSQIGIQNGDVIERINGYDINSLPKAMEVFSRLQDASDLQVQIKRNGQPVILGYQIQ